MAIEVKQHVQAQALLHRALLQAGLPFGPGMFSRSEALEVVHAIDAMIETRLAIRERQILDAMAGTLEVADEPARPELTGPGDRVRQAGDPGEGRALDDRA